MKKPLKHYSFGVALVLNAYGEEILLSENVRVEFLSLAGAKVTVHHYDGWITCDAVIPEGQSRIKWHFQVGEQEIKREVEDVQHPNLETMISEFRVALNGRL